MSEHTPTRLDHSFGRIHSADRTELTIANIARAFDGDFSEANARRLVACWNACEGITDPENVVPRLLALNERVPDLEHQAATLRAKCDELLAALQAVLDAESTYEWGGYSAEELEAREKARAAIAKVKGGAA